jgi:hypothetical protein
MKKYILGVIAILSVVVFSAFTQGNNSQAKASYDPLIFTYEGTPGGEGNSNNYDFKPGQEQECESDEGVLCEIIAEPIDPQATVLRPNLGTAQYFYRP